MALNSFSLSEFCVHKLITAMMSHDDDGVKISSSIDSQLSQCSSAALSDGNLNYGTKLFNKIMFWREGHYHEQ